MFCDIMYGMKRNILFLMIATLAFAGCRSNDAPVNNIEYDDCINCAGVQMVKYSMPNGNDLKLETDHHVIEIEAVPGKSYDYYVWTGEKTYDDDPDLVIQDGNASVLVAE